jgi:hypothetical protein
LGSDLTVTDSVLEANWTPENLNKIIILGNSLKRYDLDEEYFAYRPLTNKVQVILDSDHMLHEMSLPQTDISINLLYTRSFHGLSWHFFDWNDSLHGFERQNPRMFAANNGTTEEIIKKIHLAREKLEKSSSQQTLLAKLKEQYGSVFT